jgi:hypothetical protein
MRANPTGGHTQRARVRAACRSELPSLRAKRRGARVRSASSRRYRTAGRPRIQ